MRRSLSEIVRRHEILRTCFRTVAGRPIQVIEATPNLSVPIVDLTEVPEEAREEQADRLCREQAERPFALDRDLMLRAVLFRFEKDKAHSALEPASYCFRCLVVRDTSSRARGALRGLLERTSLAIARVAGSVCRFCCLAAGAANRGGLCAPNKILETSAGWRGARCWTCRRSGLGLPYKHFEDPSRRLKVPASLTIALKAFEPA